MPCGPSSPPRGTSRPRRRAGPVQTHYTSPRARRIQAVAQDGDAAWFTSAQDEDMQPRARLALGHGRRAPARDASQSVTCHWQVPADRPRLAVASTEVPGVLWTLREAARSRSTGSSAGPSPTRTRVDQVAHASTASAPGSAASPERPDSLAYSGTTSSTSTRSPASTEAGTVQAEVADGGIDRLADADRRCRERGLRSCSRAASGRDRLRPRDDRQGRPPVHERQEHAADRGRHHRSRRRPGLRTGTPSRSRSPPRCSQSSTTRALPTIGSRGSRATTGAKLGTLAVIRGSPRLNSRRDDQPSSTASAFDA